MLDTLAQLRGLQVMAKLNSYKATTVATVMQYISSIKGTRGAVAYGVDGQWIASFPARLNGGIIPEVKECAALCRAIPVKHMFSPRRSFNKADIDKLPAAAKTLARAHPNQEVCLPTFAKLFFFTRGEMQGYWVFGYSYDSSDARPYCFQPPI